MAENFFGCCGRWDDSYARILASELPQNVALGAVVDRDDVELRIVGGAVTLVPFPGGLVPFVSLGGGDFLGEVEAFEPGEVLEFRDDRGLMKIAVGGVRHCAVGHALLTDARGQRPG